MSGHIATRLLEGEANLGVISCEVYSDEMELQEFFEDAISVVVPVDHPWALRSSIQPSELIGVPLIMREDTSGTRRVMLSELAKHDISLEDLNIFMQLGNAEAAVRTVAAGYGVSFVSSLAAECLLARGNVASVQVEGLELSRTIYMARKRLAPPHRPQDAFWGFVHDPANLDLLRLAT